jgi:hypothetical protein
MTEDDYFEFIEQYLQLFADKTPEREKIEIDENLAKL